MLHLNLLPVFSARGIEKPYYFLVKLGISPSTAKKMLNNETTALSFKHIESLCKLLFCEPSDLFAWTPKKNEFLQENHPLQKLKNNPTTVDVQQTLSNIPYKQLMEMCGQLKSSQQQDLKNPEATSIVADLEK